MPHRAVKRNMLIDIDVEPVQAGQSDPMSCEITNLVTGADHAHFVADRCTKWVWSAFNVQIFKGSRGFNQFGAISIQCPKTLGGSRDPGHAPFRKILRGTVRTVPGNIRVKFEVRRFNRFGVISI